MLLVSSVQAVNHWHHTHFASGNKILTHKSILLQEFTNNFGMQSHVTGLHLLVWWFIENNNSIKKHSFINACMCIHACVSQNALNPASWTQSSQVPTFPKNLYDKQSFYFWFQLSGQCHIINENPLKLPSIKRVPIMPCYPKPTNNSNLHSKNCPTDIQFNVLLS